MDILPILVLADGVNPYSNLALEEYLLSAVSPGECILYLWQNAKTIVLGRNQNVYKECNCEKFLGDGGFIARRSSGGGCVFHDLGNLNFSFIAADGDYSVERQLSVIIRALRDFGLFAEKTGRNDICVDGRKFSGNAFFAKKGCSCHHGTILIDSDMSKMSEYLSVSAEKLKSKGVASVKARVVNLKELNPAIDLQGIRDSMVRAFGEIYGGTPRYADIDEMDKAEISALIDKYSSDEWIYGTRMKADYSLSGRFSWGEIEIMLAIVADKIINAEVFSDSMDAEIAQNLKSCLVGVVFGKKTVLDAIYGLSPVCGSQITGNLYELFEKQEIWHI